MAVAFDAKSSEVDVGGIGQSITSLTDNSLTVGNEANRVLVYSLNFGYGSPTNISVVWDAIGANQPLSLVVQSLNNSGNGLSQLWGLVAPGSGNKILSVSWTNPVQIVKGAGASFTGANQIGGDTTFNFTNISKGVSTTTNSILSVDVPTSITDAVVGTSVATGAGLYGSTNNIEIYSTDGLIDSSLNYELNGSSPATMNVSCFGGSVDWAYVGTNISAAPPPASGTVTLSKKEIIVSAVFNGHSGIGGGAISVSGLRVGDKLIWLQSNQFSGGNEQFNSAGYFEIIISVNDQIQQLVTPDLSSWAFNAIFIRGV